VAAEVRRVVIEQCEIVAVAEDGEQAIAAVVRLSPDVLIVDISMPSWMDCRQQSSSRR